MGRRDGGGDGPKVGEGSAGRIGGGPLDDAGEKGLDDVEVVGLWGGYNLAVVVKDNARAATTG